MLIHHSPAPFYSLSFSQNPNWSSFYPSGPEIDAYANNVVDKHGLRDHISLNTEVISCQWDDKSHH
jgi:cation diffusion facilitator CzcD-associated flavoprotein CzcO